MGHLSFDNSSFAQFRNFALSQLRFVIGHSIIRHSIIRYSLNFATSLYRNFALSLVIR